MSLVAESLRVLHLQEPPSAHGFSSAIEPSNVPAVFHGAIDDWDAVSRWDPSRGGLDYLEERVGSADVDAMQSNSAPVFYGDIRSHERVRLSFSTFLSSCKSYVQNAAISSCSSVPQEDTAVEPVKPEESFSSSLDSLNQLYLAQVPILNTDNEEKTQLETLRNDIQTPQFLAEKSLMSINLWMNKARSRSSTHYDPYHNLLCIVAGSKKVVLWPPSACPLLYPMPIHGESSNHSAVDIENPDLSVHLRAKHSKDYSQTTILRAGDALFIPEGWFHQVDSDDLTIAVNFWWKSYMMSNMLEHMDAYYLRRILNRLVGNEMHSMLHKTSVSSLTGKEYCEPTVEATTGLNGALGNVRGSKEAAGLMLQQLEPSSIKVLYELISLVHDTVRVAGQNESSECTSLKDSVLLPKCEDGQTSTDNSSILETDLIASIFWAVEPLALKRVLVALAHHFPRTLEALILHVLSPVAAEVLTRKFDEMDKHTTKEQQDEFYQLFYSVFDDPCAAMGEILSKKELFSFQAVQSVLEQYLGLCVHKSK
ncbi:uncharacterized protein M6B38_413980 [Iris pallida]|uniref:JmjC domain-containing protein n=1 Tax=Iris pallida TaxID=29817 RepID=A0AAX6FKV6_IRIPA|nr:uncharacterized protein M6B38_413980 [Iris pallida]